MDAWSSGGSDPRNRQDHYREERTAFFVLEWAVIPKFLDDKEKAPEPLSLLTFGPKHQGRVVISGEQKESAVSRAWPCCISGLRITFNAEQS